MVSHRWLLQAREPGIKASHLSCAARAIVHGKGIVKVHGVFPSSCGQPASSPALQVRRVSRQDSRTFVTPFVQVGTYPTRNFAQFCYAFTHHQYVLGRARLSVVPLDVPSIAALSAEGTLLRTINDREVEWTFLPLSACRHAVRTISFPTLVGIWHIVSEDSSKIRKRNPRG